MRRVSELDAIRGLAALGVMIFHLDPSASSFQGVRVDLFLLLSGYLVTSIILKRGDATNFYVPSSRRGGCCGSGPFTIYAWRPWWRWTPGLARSTAIDALPNYLTFTQNIQHYWSDSVPPFKWYYIHTWSLASNNNSTCSGRSCWAWRVGRAGPAGTLARGRLGDGNAWGYHWWILIARCDGSPWGASWQ